MSLSIIGTIAPEASSPTVQKAAPAPTQSQPSSPASGPDTVTLSAAGIQASQGGDADHDGDSH